MVDAKEAKWHERRDGLKKEVRWLKEEVLRCEEVMEGYKKSLQGYKDDTAQLMACNQYQAEEIGRLTKEAAKRQQVPRRST